MTIKATPFMGLKNKQTHTKLSPVSAKNKHHVNHKIKGNTKLVGAYFVVELYYGTSPWDTDDCPLGHRIPRHNPTML